MKSFAEICKVAPSIHVFDPEDGGVAVLESQECDRGYYEERLWIGDDVKGDGSRKNPYRSDLASPASPHYSIISL